MSQYAHANFFAIVIVLATLGYGILFLFDSVDAVRLEDGEMSGTLVNVKSVVVDNSTSKKILPSSIHSNFKQSVSVVRAGSNVEENYFNWQWNETSKLPIESIKIGELVDADGVVSDITPSDASIKIGELVDVDGIVSDMTPSNAPMEIGEPVDADEVVSDITPSNAPVNIGEPVDADGVLDSTTSPSIPVMIGDPMDAGNPNNAYYFSN
jgi:hypothetical protein